MAKTERLSEERLLKNVDAHGAHADELPSDACHPIFAYRAFDLRDRFPTPFPTFRQALEAIQSDTAYLPEQPGEIVAYLRDGTSIGIPRRFFIYEVKRFTSATEARNWLEVGDTLSEPVRKLRYGEVDLDAALDSQFKQALKDADHRVVSPEHNDAVCSAVEERLTAELALRS